MARSLLIGGSSSQSHKTRDERDRPLQIVGGDGPNNDPKFAYSESAAAKPSSTETETVYFSFRYETSEGNVSSPKQLQYI